jgi:thiamine kinase-like enzyme
MAEAGGPDTMLHGDLWPTNLMIVDTGARAAARLIDWDHVGAGPICYDLSTLLYRFERSRRAPVLDAYRTAVARAAGWRLPAGAELNVLCDTAECARYANRIIWPAIALLQEGAAWGFTELAEIDEWFEALEPMLDA